MSDAAKLRQLVLEALTAVAPDITADMVEDGTDFRQDLDIDSVDYLNFVIRLHETTGLEIPETDYPQLGTLTKAVAYLSRAGL